MPSARDTVVTLGEGVRGTRRWTHTKSQVMTVQGDRNNSGEVGALLGRPYLSRGLYEGRVLQEEGTASTKVQRQDHDGNFQKQPRDS